VLLIVIFSTGWVVTSGSAQAKAEEMAEKAVVDHLAPICVAQFRKTGQIYFFFFFGRPCPRNSTRLAVFLKTSSTN